MLVSLSFSRSLSAAVWTARLVAPPPLEPKKQGTSEPRESAATVAHATRYPLSRSLPPDPQPGAQRTHLESVKGSKLSTKREVQPIAQTLAPVLLATREVQPIAETLATVLLALSRFAM